MYIKFVTHFHTNHANSINSQNVFYTSILENTSIYRWMDVTHFSNTFDSCCKKLQ